MNVSKEFDDFVFECICDITVELYETTTFPTYQEYCGFIRNSIEGEQNGKYLSNIREIMNHLKRIFSFEDLECVSYVRAYLASDEEISKNYEYRLYRREKFPNPFDRILS